MGTRLAPITAIFALTLAPAAFAAAPANDDYADATEIDAVPYADAVDTRDATTEAGEPDWFGWGAGPTVWYAWTPDADGWFAASTAGSEPSTGCPGTTDCYDTTVTVWTVDATGALTFVASNDDFGGARTSYATFEATAGETYVVQVGTYSGTAGGDLAFAVEAYDPPDPFTLTATLGAAQVNLHTGEVKASGTITCSEPGEYTLTLNLGQSVGRFTTRAFATVWGVCDETTASWTATGFSDGKVVGRASYTLVGYGMADATGVFGSTVTDGTITSKGRGR